MFHALGIEHNLGDSSASSFLWLNLSPTNILKNLSILMRLCMATFPQPKADDSSTNQSFSLSALLHPTYLTATHLPSTSGLAERTVTIPLHRQPAATSAFPTSSNLKIVATTRTPGRPSATNSYMNINASEASTRPPGILLDMSHLKRIASSPWTMLTDLKSLVKVCSIPLCLPLSLMSSPDLDSQHPQSPIHSTIDAQTREATEDLSTHRAFNDTPYPCANKRQKTGISTEIRTRLKEPIGPDFVCSSLLPPSYTSCTHRPRSPSATRMLPSVTDRTR